MNCPPSPLSQYALPRNFRLTAPAASLEVTLTSGRPPVVITTLSANVTLSTRRSVSAVSRIPMPAGGVVAVRLVVLDDDVVGLVGPDAHAAVPAFGAVVVRQVVLDDRAVHVADHDALAGVYARAVAPVVVDVVVGDVNVPVHAPG